MEGTAELFTGFAERIAREKGTQQEMMREPCYGCPFSFRFWTVKYCG